MKRLLLGAVSAIVLTTTPALAQTYDPDSGWYVRGNAGYGQHDDIEFRQEGDANQALGLFSGDVESEGNVAATAGIGYEFGKGSPLDNWRVELDGDTLWTDLGAIDQQPNSFAKVRTNSLMLNAIYALDRFSGGFSPYFGAGAGIINADLDAAAQAFTANGQFFDNPACFGANSGACSVSDSDTTLGWQALAGVDYQISENLFWDTHVSYQDSFNDFDFRGNFTPINNFAAGQFVGGGDSAMVVILPAHCLLCSTCYGSTRLSVDVSGSVAFGGAPDANSPSALAT